MKTLYGIRNCAICNAPYKSSHEREKCCSLTCGYELRRRHFRDKAEQHLGEPLKAGIEKRLADGVGMKEIARACGLNDMRALHRLMADLQIPRRNRSESARLQWKNNETRRAAWGHTIRQWKQEHPQAALEHSLMGNIALQSTSPTSIERALMAALDEAGIQYQFQFVIGSKFLCDLAFPKAMLIVECDGSYWHSTPQQRRRDASKDAYLQACGYTVLRFSDKQIETDVHACVRAIHSLIS